MALFCAKGEYPLFAAKKVISQHKAGNNNTQGKQTMMEKKHNTHADTNPEKNKTDKPLHTNLHSEMFAKSKES